jgi:hypothetical protein
MMATKKNTSGHPSSASTESASNPQDLLNPIFALLLRAGYGEQELIELCGKLIRNAKVSKKGPPVFRIGEDYITADLVRRWLRDPKYINSQGKPKELAVTGICSLQSLIHDCGSRAAVSSVAALLIKFGTVKRLDNGALRLVRRSLNFTIPDGLPFEPNFRFLVDAVRSSTRGLGQNVVGPRLYWHCADSKQIPKKDEELFLRFSEERSLSFMHEINDWLDQHAITGAAQGRLQSPRVGVGLFAICGNASSGKKVAKKARRQ